MGSEQSGNASASLVRRPGRWARGKRYMVGASLLEPAASDVSVGPGHRPAVATPAVDGFAVRAFAATEG